MEKKEIIVNEIIIVMQDHLNADQLHILDEVLCLKLRGIRFEEECTELSTQQDDNEYMIKLFAANKRLEGCREQTISHYIRQNRDLLEKLNKNYKDITKDDIKYYLAIYSQRVKPNTVVNVKRYLSTFYGWLHDEGYISRNPVKAIKGIKQTEVPNKHLSMEEEVAVRDVEKSKRDEAIIDFLLSTGVRVGEIEAMNRSNVNLITGAVTFIGEKNYKERTVYLDVRAKKHLIEYLQTRTDTDDALFVSDRKVRNEHGTMEVRRMRRPAYQKLVKGVCAQAGITDKICTVHVFRKTFATRLAENGCALEIIQVLLGHSSAEITSKHYVAKTQKRIRQEFERCMAA